MGNLSGQPAETLLAMYPFFEGVFFGLLLSVMIGPVFFTLLQTSLKQGFKQGFAVALGATSSDMCILSAALLGFINVSLNQVQGKIIGGIGVAILLITGVLMIRNKRLDLAADEEVVSKRSILSCYAKGFLINSMNPFVFIFWFGVIGFTSAKYQHDLSLLFMFAAGSFVAVFSTDIIKIYLSGKLRNVLNKRWTEKTSIAIGVVVIIYSLQLLWQII